MRIYFVRHGLSVSNQKRQFQDESDRLSDWGRKQAEVVAKRFEQLPVDLIIASPYERAKNTAEIINSVVKKEIIFSNLLVENRVPKEIVGKQWEDPDALRVHNLIREKFHLEHWHYAEEENFFDVKHRAEGFLNYLNERKENNILVVTHGMIMKMITAVMIFGDDLKPEIFIRYDRSHVISNTGITICDKLPDGLWQIMTFNDRLHVIED